MGSSKNIDTNSPSPGTRLEARYEFTVGALEHVLRHELHLSPATPLKVAFSGGLDSSVLIHALGTLRVDIPWNVSAIYVDHGLHPDSRDWGEHCAAVCAALKIPFTVTRVTVAKASSGGLEDAARRARYGALADALRPGEVLLTAHQRDDQAETLLLQLLRGAGIHGLAAMPPIAPLKAARLARPLLSFTRAALASYAAAARLTWIDDASNGNVGMARNFLRRDVMPVIARRWGAASERLARTAGHCAEAASVLDEIAAADCHVCAGAHTHALSIPALNMLSRGRQANALRFWVQMHDLHPPPERAIAQLLAQIARAPRTGRAMVGWNEGEVRRYRDTFVLFTEKFSVPLPGWETEWDLVTPLAVPGGGQRLCVEPGIGHGLARTRVIGRSVRVRLRRGGESCRLPGRSHRSHVKKLLQDAGVAPWERQLLPFVFVDGELAAIGDRWVCEPFVARATEASWVLVLKRISSH